jgi:hypothetical protein
VYEPLILYSILYRYVHFIAESAQYIYNDIPSMAGFFNWSMCNKRDADFWRPDGRIIQVRGSVEFSKFEIGPD